MSWQYKIHGEEVSNKFGKSCVYFEELSSSVYTSNIMLLVYSLHIVIVAILNSDELQAHMDAEVWYYKINPSHGPWSL